MLTTFTKKINSVLVLMEVGGSFLDIDESHKCRRLYAWQIFHSYIIWNGFEALDVTNVSCSLPSPRSLRDWAVGVTKATQEQLAKDTAPQSDSKKSADQTMKSIRGQFDSALARLEPPPGAAQDSLPFISYPVAKLTYPECIDEFDDLSQVV